MKRFVECDRWRDPWYLELSFEAKAAFSYICDNCDCVGVWDANYRLANFCLKRDLEWDSILEELGSRIQKRRGGKIWVRKFVEFQYGTLSDACKPHIKYLATLEKHGIEVAECYREWGVDAAEEAQEHVRHGELPLREERTNGRDLVLEALAEVQGTDLARATPKEKERMAKAAAAIREVEPGVTPDRIKSAAKAWRKKGYSAPATAATLASHWATLTPPPPAADFVAMMEKMEARLTELSQPGAGSSRIARADLTGAQREEYESLGRAFNEAVKKGG